MQTSALVITDSEAIALAGQIANRAAASGVFEDCLQRVAPNTLK